jgi:hypothetical protein
MRILRIFLLSLAAWSAFCKKEPQAPLEPTTLDKVCTEAFGPYYDERKHIRFHRVSFEGYLQTPKSAMISSTMFVDAYAGPNRTGKKLLASFRVGTGKNQVEKLKSGFRENDLKIESSTGQMLGNGSKVKITGDVSPGGIPGKWLDGCYVRVESVEAAP